MQHYRYIGSFPLVLRTNDGRSFFLRYGQDFFCELELQHPLIIKVKGNDE